MSPPRETHVYSFGYTNGWDHELLMEAIEKYQFTLVDIRIMPRSRLQGWNKSQLLALLGHRYVHVPDLGNLAYKSGGIQLANPEAGLLTIEQILSQSSVALMCVCRDFDRCHRAAVASLIKERLGADTWELFV